MLEQTTQRRWLAGICLLLLPLYPHANMRAPIFSNYGAHQALKKHEQTVVERETLSVQCRLPSSAFERGNCRFEAIYHLKAAQKAEAQLQFVIPMLKNHRMGNNSMGVKSILVNNNRAPFKLDTAKYDTAKGDHAPQYTTVRFHAELAPATVIKVIYEQDASVYEATSPAYFRSPKLVWFFDYALFPLKEWRLAEDFSLTVHVSVNTGKTRILPWRRRVLACHACTRKMNQNGWWPKCPPVARKARRIKGRLEFKHTFGKTFPEVIHCESGFASLVRTYREQAGDEEEE